MIKKQKPDDYWTGHHWLDDEQAQAPLLKALPGPVGEFIAYIVKHNGNAIAAMRDRPYEAWAFVEWLRQHEGDESAYDIAFKLAQKLDKQLLEM